MLEIYLPLLAPKLSLFPGLLVDPAPLSKSAGCPGAFFPPPPCWEEAPSPPPHVGRAVPQPSIHVRCHCRDSIKAPKLLRGPRSWGLGGVG